MVLKLTNNPTSTLAGTIGTADTTIAVQSADASKYPSLSAGDWFPVTVVDNAGNMEIMRCTARAGAVLTVQRAQEGTAAFGFAAGARVDLRLTSKTVTEIRRMFMTNIDCSANPNYPAAHRGDVYRVSVAGKIGAAAGLDVLFEDMLYCLTDDTAAGDHATVGAQWMRVGGLVDTAAVKDKAITLAKLLDIGPTLVLGRARGATPALAAPALLTDAQLRAILGFPVGLEFPWGGDTPPAGALFMYGQNISRTTYSELFAVWSTRYGAGDGSTTFGVKDRRGRVSAGRDDMGGVAAGRLGSQISATVLGAVGGAETHVLTLAQMAAHAHSGNTGTESADHSHGATLGWNARFGANPSGVAEADWGSGDSIKGFASRGITTGGRSAAHYHGFTSDTQGGNAAHINLQPTIIDNWCVFTGVFT